MRLTQAQKIRLLAATYLDACEAGRSEHDGSHGKPGSRQPRRNLDLWHKGSYRQLEKAMDELKEATRRDGNSGYLWFWWAYVRCFPLHDAHEQEGAERALKFVVRRVEEMTGRNIYVPGEIVENAGFTLQDARACQKPRRLAA